ncbi:MAG: hypothetical protein PHF60_04860 [Candidatus ainarchaeum sp.]|nr:hypothetical protein [Candidatus ainarchaeum sp.]
MKNENNLLLSYFIIVVLLVCTVYFWNDNNLLTLQLADRESELANVHAELGAKDIFVAEAKQDLLDLRRSITDVQNSLNESTQWFTDNSRMSGSLENFTADVEDACITDTVLDLACIKDEMSNRLDFRFRSEWEDRLYSIDEMVGRQGGDCDDYSLFMKAMLNTMKEDKIAANLSARNNNLHAVFMGLGDERSPYDTSDMEYVGDLQSIYPIAICYTLSAHEEAISGHCIDALSTVPIESLDDLAKLDGAQTFDPQDGTYTGEIGDEFYICQDGETDCERNRDSVTVVITDGDIYEFKEGRWNYLGQYEVSIETMLGQVDGTLSRCEAWD